MKNLATRKSPRNECRPERNRGQIDPAVLRVFAHKRQPVKQNSAPSRIPPPTFPGNLQSLFCRLLAWHFCNCHVRYVRPLLDEGQRPRVQPVVQFSQRQGCMRHPDVYRRSRRSKAFHSAQRHLKRFHLAANLSQNLQRRILRSLQRPRGQQREMRCEVGQFRVQLPPEVLHELSHRTSYVRH